MELHIDNIRYILNPTYKASADLYIAGVKIGVLFVLDLSFRSEDSISVVPFQNTQTLFSKFVSYKQKEFIDWSLSQEAKAIFSAMEMLPGASF
jgi:hypothetical protein